MSRKLAAFVCLRQLARSRSTKLFFAASAYDLLPPQLCFSSVEIPNSIPATSSVPTTFFPKPFSQLPFSQHRSFSPSSGPSNIVNIKSEDEFKSALSKAQDGSLPAIFYYTAVWCGPCRFISPIIGQLSEQYPHVITYKVDIDEEALGSTLSKLNITSVPTFHFFQNGNKAAEIIGADVAKLKITMEKLY